MEQYQKIERSIIKTYRKEIWSCFIKGINEYQMIEVNDKIAVCISGGKDSFLLAKCMQEIKRHGKVPFELEFLVMDPGYTKKNKDQIIDNAKRLNIPITIFDSDIFDVVYNVEKGHLCYLCARMRRGHLYRKAQELGCNKIALGHHFDDVIETILLNLFYGSSVKTMMPKLHSTNYQGMELIRPLYFVKEHDIKLWASHHQLTFLNCACKFTEAVSNHEQESKRVEMKELIAKLRKIHPNVDYSIMRSVENVNLETIISYKKQEQYHHFLEEYHKGGANNDAIGISESTITEC